MASCAYCNTRILFGGKRDGDRRYCNEKCLHQGLLSDAASQLSPADVQAHIFRVHKGNCPKCDGPGPVDMAYAIELQPGKGLVRSSKGAGRLVVIGDADGVELTEDPVAHGVRDGPQDAGGDGAHMCRRGPVTRVAHLFTAAIWFSICTIRSLVTTRPQQ